MLQRLLAVTALLAAAASVSDAVQVHVRIHHTHHKSNHHQTKHARAVEVDAATTTTSSTAGSAAGGAATVGATDPNAWSFSQVKSIQARVQGNTPSWDAKTKTWVASFGKTYNDQFRSVLDTVNTASVEGALMYVQAEGINVNEQSVKCERKNKMQYVVFYEMDIVQPNASIAFYGGKDSTATLEYCPYVAMDGGKCTPAGEDFPDSCKQFDGIGGQPKLGHCVGAGEQTSDKRAPYPGNYWFSYPNSCVTKGWSDKTDACRTEFAGGLCAPGVKPDGVTCSFTYKILGYLNIDDLVGITDGSAAEDGKKYKNYTEFCKAGNVEFAAKNTGSNGFEVETAIAFWEKPGDEAANEKRTQEMIDLYNELAPEFKNDAGAAMTALPEVDELAKTNPPCYKNNKDCAAASNGCRRVLYSQICEVCDKADADCVKAPSGFTFPTLEVPKPETAEGSQASSSYGVGGSGSGKQNVDAGKTDKDNKPGAKSAATATAGVSLAMAVGAMATAAAML